MVVFGIRTEEDICHRNLVEKYQLEHVKGNLEILNQMCEICHILKARILHIQTPARFEITKDNVNTFSHLLDSVSHKDMTLAWEIRFPYKKLPPYIIKMMRDQNITHCVDLSISTPSHTTDILYTRLFGKGVRNIYQFDDQELQQIEENTQRGDHSTAMLSFHGVKMYKDAARYQLYKTTNRFPTVTRSKGKQSLTEVLMEDTKFPIIKQELVKDQGWKVIDLTEKHRVHASYLLKRLPNKTYKNVGEVIENLPNL